MVLASVALPAASRYMLREASRGARSRKSMNVVRPSARRTSMKPPPPMLPAVGWVTARAKPTATAASTALPPARRTSTPAWVAWRSRVTTMACRARTGCAAHAGMPAVDPETAPFDLLERPVDVGDAHHRQVLQSARRGLGHHVGDARRAPLRNHHRARARRVGRADDGAQVVGIFDAVEHHQHFARGHGVEVGIPLSGAHGHHALVRRGAGHAVERRARLKAHGYGSAPRQIDDFLQSRPAGTLCHQQALQRVPGPQSLRHRMNAAQYRHFEDSRPWLARMNSISPPTKSNSPSFSAASHRISWNTTLHGSPPNCVTRKKISSMGSLPG